MKSVRESRLVLGLPISSIEVFIAAVFPDNTQLPGYSRLNGNPLGQIR